MLQAIETVYNGYRFRSRLEARWAVFFTCVDVEYVYEFEGYTDGNIKYLPDFYIAQFDAFFEIKPYTGKNSCVDDVSWEKAVMLSSLSNKLVYFLCGEPYFNGFDILKYEGYILGSQGPGVPFGSDNFYFWCICPDCGAIGMQYNGWADRNKHKDFCCIKDKTKIDGTLHPKLTHAYKTALGMRFEHNGNVPNKAWT